ncbi:MAG: TIGR00303 family protein [Ferroplasma sp.]
MIIIKGNNIFKSMKNKKDVLFILLAGSSKISLVPGISAAGASPDLMEYTPVLDSEIIQSGKCKSYDVIPMTAEGIPTPSIITRACNNISGIDTLIVDAGFTMPPHIPYIHTGCGAAEDFTSKTALPDYDTISEYGKYIGSILDGKYKFIVIAESVPGGTTTAYAVLRALGYNEMTSSSMKNNPDKIKMELVDRAFKRHKYNGNYEDAIREYGDYMMDLSISISGAIHSSKVIFAGGTQMATVYMLDRKINKDNDRYVFTTGYVMKDAGKLMQRLCGSNIIYSDIDFNGIDGLDYYDKGFVKEGAGFGASVGIAAALGCSEDAIYDSIKNVYNSFLKI